METLPIPRLYRLTNDYVFPTINTRWGGDDGRIIKVTKVVTIKKPAIIYYKSITPNDKNNVVELSVSLHKFHSLFSSVED